MAMWPLGKRWKVTIVWTLVHFSTIIESPFVCCITLFSLERLAELSPTIYQRVWLVSMANLEVLQCKGHLYVCKPCCSHSRLPKYVANGRGLTVSVTPRLLTEHLMTCSIATQNLLVSSWMNPHFFWIDTWLWLLLNLNASLSLCSWKSWMTFLHYDFYFCSAPKIRSWIATW
jgi:hypothetical protein